MPPDGEISRNVFSAATISLRLLFAGTTVTVTGWVVVDTDAESSVSGPEQEDNASTEMSAVAMGTNLVMRFMG